MLGRKFFSAAVATAAIFSAAPAFAYVQPIAMEINQTYYLTTANKITRVAVANPKIADVTVVGASALNVVAFESGTTTLDIWTTDGTKEQYAITVSATDSGMAKLIEEAIDLPNVRVQKVGGRVLLRGTVENQYEKNLAVRIASLFLNSAESGAGSTATSRGLLSSSVTVNDEDVTNPNVINLLEMTNPDQINFEAVIMEINSDDAKQLGLTWSSPKGGSTYSTSDSLGTVTLNDPGFFYFGETYGEQREAGNHWYSRNWLFRHFSQINANLRLLVEKDRARVVSRPNITTMSGKTAGIHLGGTILYPKSAGNSTTSIEEKDYGIKLNLINPVVDRQGNVTTRLYASVSSIDNANGVTLDGYTIPGLRERSADTMVNIPSGMTMVIGGMIDSEEADNVQKVPLLSSIPWIGELFKYHYKTRDKSEIIIFITPRVVNESTPAKMTAKMRDYYRENQEDVDSRYDVDLNEQLKERDVREKPKKEETNKNGTAAKDPNRKVRLLGGDDDYKQNDEMTAKEAADEQVAAEKTAEEKRMTAEERLNAMEEKRKAEKDKAAEEKAEAERKAEEKAKAKAEKEEQERKRKEPKAKASEDKDSLIGKYLNQKVLPGVTEEQTESAMRD